MFKMQQQDFHIQIQFLTFSSNSFRRQRLLKRCLHWFPLNSPPVGNSKNQVQLHDWQSVKNFDHILIWWKVMLINDVFNQSNNIIAKNLQPSNKCSTNPTIPLQKIFNHQINVQPIQQYHCKKSLSVEFFHFVIAFELRPVQARKKSGCFFSLLQRKP